MEQKQHLLITEVCIVLVESAQVAVVRGRGAEKNGGRQVVAAIFEELVHLSGNAGLNGDSVPLKVQVWISYL